MNLVKETMTGENQTTQTKICPTCGTRLSSNATRCTVCGTVLVDADGKTGKDRTVPEISLSLPALLGLIVLLLAVGAGTVYAVFQFTQPAPQSVSAPTLTPSITPTQTMTPTPSPTATLEPTATERPPFEYKVAPLDTCISIASTFNVSVQSIIILNKLPAACDNLVVGQTLLIPYPTVTPTPLPTNTLDPTQQAEAACEKLEYTVTETDTLSKISANYGVSAQAIRDYNGLPGDIIFPGQKLIIPLCERGPKPTPTPTPIPPYPAPNLLLPTDGASFLSLNDIITLQWASVGELRPNEAYAVSLIDATDSSKGKFVAYVTETKYIVPEQLRPTDGKLHIFRWSVLPVRQTGTNKETNEPIWEPAGAVSAERVFAWASK